HGFVEALLLDQALEFGRAGDVGALAHVDEQRVLGDDQRFQSGKGGVTAHGAGVSVHCGGPGTMPDGVRASGGRGGKGQAASEAGRGGLRGACCPTAAAMASICSGVVPQQPPTRFTSPACANSPRRLAMCSGVSSYSASALGSPALGCVLMRQSAMPASAWMCGRRSSAPSAQLSPIDNGRACL